MFFYRTIFKYRVYKSYIGWATIFAVDDAELNGCRIGRRNKFYGPMHIRIREGAIIGVMNNFTCGQWAKEDQYKSSNFDRYLDIGEEALITSNHHFDLVGSFTLGSYSWIAGTGSQFWTHGARVQDRNIIIGKNCYLGSAVRFAPGSSVGDNCIVTLASVVTKKMPVNNAMIAGHPAKIIRENYDWKTRKDLFH